MAVPTHAQRYEIHLLDTAGYPSNDSFALNGGGAVVGSVSSPQAEYPAAWPGKKQGRVLPGPNGLGEGRALDINDALEAVGVTDRRGVLWEGATGLAFDIHPDGRGNSQLEGANELGSLVGWWWEITGESGGFLWRDGDFTSLGDFFAPLDINELEQIVGHDGVHPYIWQDGVLRELPPLVEGQSASAWAINDLGVIVGEAYDADLNRRGVIWDGERVIDIGSTAPGAQVWARAINNNGDVVGARSRGDTERGAALLWRHNLLMEIDDLTGEPGLAQYAEDINDEMQIVVRTHSNTAARLDPLDDGLLLASFEPAEVGRRNALQMTHATPGGRVAVIYGLARGDSFISFQGCPNVLINIAQPRLAGLARADAAGLAELSINIPAQALGRTFILQAIDATTCEVSPPAWVYLQR